MAEAFSVFAAAVNVADAAARSSGEVARLLRAWRDAPELVLQLANEAADLAVVLEHFQEAENGSSNERTVRSGAGGNDNNPGMGTAQKFTVAVRRQLETAGKTLEELQSLVAYLQAGRSGPSRRKRWVARQGKAVRLKCALKEAREKLRDHVLANEVSSTRRIEMLLQSMEVDLQRLPETMMTSLQKWDAAKAGKLLMDGESGGLSNKNTSLSRRNYAGTAAAVNVVLQRNGERCSNSCPCDCHTAPSSTSQWRFPEFAKSIVGSLFVGYSSLPSGAAPGSCSHARCGRNGLVAVELHYIFPPWFLAYAVSAAFEKSARTPPTFGITLRRRVWPVAPKTLLSYVIAGDVDGVRHALEVRPATVTDVDCRTGETALMWFFSSKHQDPEILRLLVAAGADFDAENDMGHTGRLCALTMLLTRKNRPPALVRELERSFRITDYVHLLDLSPLQEAVLGMRLLECGDIDGGGDGIGDGGGGQSVDRNIDLGLRDPAVRSQLDARDSEGYGALHWAARCNNVPALRALLRAGADMGAQGRRGFTPLILAIISHADDAVAALLECGDDPNREAKLGVRPLMLAIQLGALGAVRLLLDSGKIDVRNVGEDNHPVEKALLDDRPEIYELLLQRGGAYSVDDKMKVDEVSFAIINNSHRCLRLLLVKDKWKRKDWAALLFGGNGEYTELHFIAYKADAQTMRILRELAPGLQTADPYAKTDEGLTPGMYFDKREAHTEELRQEWDELLIWVEDGKRQQKASDCKCSTASEKKAGMGE